MKVSMLTTVLAVSFLAGCDRDGANPPADPPTATPQTDRDNTAVNERDRAATNQTAGQAGQSKSDVEIAAEIRRKVVETQMSVNAQNAKIVVLDGSVTLRGPVKNQEEKDTIARMAAEVSGVQNINNQLEVEVNQ